MVEVTASVRPGEGKAAGEASREEGRGGGSGEGRTPSRRGGPPACLGPCRQVPYPSPGDPSSEAAPRAPREAPQPELRSSEPVWELPLNCRAQGVLSEAAGLREKPGCTERKIHTARVGVGGQACTV